MLEGGQLYPVGRWGGGERYKMGAMLVTRVFMRDMVAVGGRLVGAR